MNINLRQAVKNNLKDLSSQNMHQTISDATNQSDDVVLPGLGVLFEILWKHSDNTSKESIVKTISTHL